MPSTIQIQVSLDEKGVVTGVQNVNQSLDKIQQHAQPAFQGITKGQLEARQSLNELAYAFGFQLPGEITKAVSKFPALATAIEGLAEVAGIATLITGIIELGVHVDEAKAKFIAFGRDVDDFAQRTGNLFSGNGWNPGSFGLENQAKDISNALTPLFQQYESLSAKASSAGLQGVAAIKAQTDAEINSIQIAQKMFQDSALDKYGDSDTYAKLVSSSTAIAAAEELAVEQTKDREILALRKDTLQQIQDAQSQADSAGLTGFQQLIAQESHEIQKRNQELAKQGFGYLTGQADAAIIQKADSEFMQRTKDWTKEISDLGGQLASAGLQGFDAIDTKVGAQQAKLIEEFDQKVGNINPYPDPQTPEQKKISQEWLSAAHQLQNGLTAIAQSGERERQLQQRQIDDEIIDADNNAAIATLPQWQRAGAQIVEDYNQRFRQIQEQLHDGIIPSEQDATQLIQAAWTQMNAQIVDNTKQTRDEMASQIESVFDDITSGNVGHAILSEIKHLFSEIVAQWLLSLNAIKGAGSLNGEGLFGSLFSSLFGGGSGSGGIGSLFSGSVNALGAGSGALLTGAGIAPIAFSAGGGSSLISNLTSPFGGASSGIISHLQSPFAQGAGISAGIGTAGAVQQQAANTVLESSLAKFFPHGLSIGGVKISGAQLGALGAGAALESSLFAYSSGNPIIGGIGGAGGGALAGFSIGGPLGAVVGGAIGGIVGLLSGIFGGQARKNKALSLINNTLAPNIADIVTSYEQFNTDQADALSELNDLEQQAKDQLDQLGQDKLYWSNLVPQVVNATDQINQIEAIRDQRSSLNFAPPQFASGGTIPGIGAVPIIAHAGEEIVRQPFASMYRPILKAMNNGGMLRTNDHANSGQIVNHYHLNISAMDAKSFEAFATQDQNAKALRRALRSDILTRGQGSLHV